MPVDLRALPAPLAPPCPPRRWHLCLIVMATALPLGVAAVLLWPPAWASYALWFWCCTLVLPLMAGGGLSALRLRGYEAQRAYVQSWNRQHDQQRAALIERGQRYIDVVGYAYCSPAGNNLLAQALGKGAKGLQAIYVPSLLTTLRVGQLAPVARDDSLEEYTRRLSGFFRQVMGNLDQELQRCAHDRETPLSVRIRHDQVLTDEQVLALWRDADSADRQAARVVFAGREDGLLWLDAWLDAPEAVPLLLSLEVHLFQAPRQQQAESVSGLLLAHPSLRGKQATAPLARIHRPVRITDTPLALEDALRWGQLSQAPEQTFFIWQSQLPDGFAAQASIAMRSMGHAVDVERCHCLDDSFGLPMHAVGHMALIIACEQANASGQAQFLMLQDASLQCCVVRHEATGKDKDL